MSNDELTALAGLTFNWTRALDDVWTDQRYHVDGLHAVTAALIGSGIRSVTADGARPLGIVIQGQRGVGKTHLLGWTREQVQRQGGFFFLVGDLFTKAFWEQVLGSMVEQLLPLPDGSRNQLAALLTRLADLIGLEGSFRAQVTGEVPPTPEGVKVFIAALRRAAPSLGLICQDTARALVLLASPLQEDQDVGYYYLTGNEVDLQDRRRWRINSTRKIPRLLVNEVSQLLALAGPIVLAIDQVDALIDELVGRSADDAAQVAAAGGRGDRADGAARRRAPHPHDRLLPPGELGVHPQVRGGHRHRPVPRGPPAAEHPQRRRRPPDDREAVRGRLRAGRLRAAVPDLADPARRVRRREQVHRARPPQADRGARRLVPAGAENRRARPAGRGAARPAVGHRRRAGRVARPRDPGPGCSPGSASRPPSAPRSTRRPRTRRCRRCSRPASRPGPGSSAGPTTRRSFRTRCRARTRGCTRACGCSLTPGPNGSAAGRSAPSPSHSPRAVQTRLRKAIEGAAWPLAASATPAAGCSCSGQPDGRPDR